MTQNENEFNSEYCNVKYVGKNSAAMRITDSQPTMYAANFVYEHKGSNFVIDAKNGFYLESED